MFINRNLNLRWSSNFSEVFPGVFKIVGLMGFLALTVSHPPDILNNGAFTNKLIIGKSAKAAKSKTIEVGVKLA